MDGSTQAVLDPCCGSRMFWFDRADERAIYGDIRSGGTHTVRRPAPGSSPGPGHGLSSPAIPGRALRWSCSIRLTCAKRGSWMRAYGCLNPSTGAKTCEPVRRMLSRAGAFGVLIFANETQIKVSEIWR